jgi:hypothetical protein
VLPVSLIIVAVVAFAATTIFSRGGGNASGTSSGLPNTSDYHSLLVDPRNPQRLTLGTHDGLYVSGDGGRRWRHDSLSGNDAMNLARPGANTIWLAGHDVFKKSSDGGKSWIDVRPTGLPSLEVHGFAVDPRNQRVLYAAMAGQGLYRSQDGGKSFTLMSDQVGGGVMGIVVQPDGRILAADMQQGLVASSDEGRSWQQALAAQVMGLAVNPADSSRLLATGGGVALSTDGGHTWRSVLSLPNGAGPVAWSKSDPARAYVVGFDQKLYLSTDRGESWQSVGSES